MLRESGVTVLCVEDRTGALRELAARIVWHFGSLAAFVALGALPTSGPVDEFIEREGFSETPELAEDWLDSLPKIEPEGPYIINEAAARP